MTCSGSLLSQFTGWVYTTTNLPTCNGTTGSSRSSNSCNNRPTGTPTATATTATTTATTVSAIFDLRGLHESKSNDTAPYYVKAFQCAGKDVICHVPSEDDDSTAMSYDHDHNGNNTNRYYTNSSHHFDDDDQMRRLASWGTFGTIGTTDSLDNNNMILNPICDVDDDGHPIDPQIIEKTIRNRAKLQQQQQTTKPKRRVVQFAYPPITSLKECPRIDPEQLDTLFFSDEELATYEHDRRSTGVIDDVEIVAVSTSFSDETNTAATAAHAATTTTATTTTQLPLSPKKSSKGPVLPPPPSSSLTHDKDPTASPKTFSFKSLMMSSSRPLRHGTNQLPSQQQQQQQHSNRRNSFGNGGGPIRMEEDKSSSAVPAVVTPTNTDCIPNNDQMSPEQQPKRLLKSVQIFLRERSTA